MKKGIVIVIGIIGSFILLSLGISYGHFLGRQQIEARLANITPLPRSALIQDWRTSVIGEITEVTPQSITISSEGKTLTMSLSKDTKVKKFIVKTEIETTEELPMEDLAIQDIRKGEIADIGVIADPEGNLLAAEIYISETR